MIKNYLEQDLQQAMVQSLTASQRREEAEEEEQRKEKAIKGSWVVRQERGREAEELREPEVSEEVEMEVHPDTVWDNTGISSNIDGLDEWIEKYIIPIPDLPHDDTRCTYCTVRRNN